MARRQCDELNSPAEEEGIGADRRNPLTLRDRGGKKVELVTRPVPLGAHAFILITNTQAAAGNLQGLPSKGRFAMAQEKDLRDITISSSEIRIRRIDIKDLWQALKEGLDDFNAKPSVYFFLCIFYPLFALFLTLFLIGENLLHLIFPMIAGFTLIGPVVSIGLFEISRRRELGLDVPWSSAFGFVHSSSFAGIAALSLVMMALYVAWLYMAQLIYFGLFGADPPVSVPDFVNQVLTTRRGGALIVYGTLVGFIFAVVALAISVVAFPMLLDKEVSAPMAVETSIRAVISNPLMMAVWGLIVVALLAVGAILFLIGLAAVLPILGHATWHLYRKIVES
jgi:uncharacterized membrane protein